MDPTRHMLQDVTHWAVTGSNGFGGFTFGAPTLLVGRWQEGGELFRDPRGEEVVSTAVVYLAVDVDIGDYLAEGDRRAVADPTTLNTSSAPAHRVRQRHRTTNLANLTALRKVFL